MWSAQVVDGVHQTGKGEWGYCDPACPCKLYWRKPKYESLRQWFIQLIEETKIVVTSLWVASATTVSRSRERLKKLPWVPPETLMVVSYTVWKKQEKKVGNEGVKEIPKRLKRGQK